MGRCARRPLHSSTNQRSATLPELALVSDGQALLDADSTCAARHGRQASAQTVAAVTDAMTPHAHAAAPAGRCVSVGPFNDLARAARGAALLRERGFNPRQRAEQGETWERLLGVRRRAEDRGR